MMISSSIIAEQKKQKVTEVKTGLDDAEALVM